jgi:hypothetical protein
MATAFRLQRVIAASGVFLFDVDYQTPITIHRSQQGRRCRRRAAGPGLDANGGRARMEPQGMA